MQLQPKPKHTTPLFVKLTLFLTVLIALLAFILSLNYSIKNKKNDSELQLNTALLPPQTITHGGFHTKEFSVTLTSSSDKIYYTLDGSPPSLESTVYTEPLIIKDQTNETDKFSNIPTSPRWKPPLGNVFKGMVLRAISVSNNNEKSEELVQTFWVDEKGNNRYPLPVIALTVNPEDLFGRKNGIYVLGKDYEDKDRYIRKNIPLTLPWWEYPSNYLKRGENSNRFSYLEFYEPNGNLGFSFKANIRINGNATRGFSQKSLRVSLDKNKVLNYPLFPSYSVNHFNSFLLRNSGNDWNKTMFRDALMQSLMDDSNLNTQAHRFAVLFINGEYWGIHNIQEHFDEYFLSNKYSINKDSFAILELNGNVLHGKKSDSNGFKELLTFLKSNDLSKEANFEYFKKMIDIENFMDFVIANVYFCNSDWPNNNVKFWRYRTKQQGIDSVNIRDGRWRWILYDTDWGFGYTGDDSYRLNLLEKAKKTGSVGIIFDALLKNRTFVHDFELRFKYHLKNTFSTDKIVRKIDEFQTILSPEMDEHINRWRVIGSYSNWEAYIADLKEFATKRPDVQLLQINEFINTHKQ